MAARAILLVASLVVAGLLLAQTLLVATAPPMEPLRIDPLAPDAAFTPVDEHLELATRYAPRILHETDARLGRQDVPAAMDFDGDREGANNWESFSRVELVPTVYYTLLETDTHWFLTYHLYHPRDWSRVPLGIQDTHEGDGENMQVVVEKESGDIALLVTQAHYAAWGYASLASRVRNGEETLRAEFEISTGHPIVFVESGGHGIYGSHDPRAANRLARIGEPVLAYRVAEPGEGLAEPQPPWEGSAPYRLVSLPAFLNGTREHPSLFAGYEASGSPRYHKGDRYSGPLGASRGISPFALGFGWSDSEFDALVRDPAGRLQQAYAIRGEWSTEYVHQPFRS